MKQLVSASLLLIAFMSCDFRMNQKTDFYSYTKSGDLWRVPLLDPYEIVSTSNSGLNDWCLILANHKIEGPNYFRSSDRFSLSSIKSLGIQDSVIVVTNENQSWPKLSGQYSSTLIIDMKTGDQFLYSNEHHDTNIKSKTHELQIEGIQMLDWEQVKDEFMSHQKLPENWNVQGSPTKSQLH